MLYTVMNSLREKHFNIHKGVWEVPREMWGTMYLVLLLPPFAAQWAVAVSFFGCLLLVSSSAADVAVCLQFKDLEGGGPVDGGVQM